MCGWFPYSFLLHWIEKEAKLHLVLCFKFKRGRNPRKRCKTGPNLAFEEGSAFCSLAGRLQVHSDMTEALIDITAFKSP